jgi:flagellum-specific peptidoglycan hydrolase FlgJ
MELKKSKYLPVIITVLLIGFAILVGEKLLMEISKFIYKEDNQKAKRWIDWMTPLAKKIGSERGLPWQALVVQTAIETNWGKSELFQNENNFAGIKAVGTQKFSSYRTTENVNGQNIQIMAKFAKFATPLDGLNAYANFFHKNKRYATALQFPTDSKQFVIEIKKAGYATDPLYISKLHGMIDKYKLV